jgi:hypothetical protein
MHLSPIHVICPSHLYLITQIIFGEEYRSLSSLCNFFHSPANLSLDPNILLSTLFSNTLSLYSFLNESDQVSHIC